MIFRSIVPALLLAVSAVAARADAPAVEMELRHNTQVLLDAIAPGDVATWDRLLDPKVIQVDENDMVRDKAEILAELKPLGPGLIGNLQIDDFRVALYDDIAVVTHEDKEYLDYHGQVLRSRFRMTDTWRHTPQGWRLLGEQVLAVQQDPPSVPFDGKSCAYAGRYALTADIVATIGCNGDALSVERPGKPARTFLAETPDVFFEPGSPRTRRIFQRDAAGHVTGFVDRREERDIAWKKLP
ncbi:MAG TPA: nuclear transport factor 2 family protein [Alphaproteobacteria bacterium]|nr:nuclear transport factor 2 family protein [Alphaproteobacteria bacterium]